MYVILSTAAFNIPSRALVDVFSRHFCVARSNSPQRLLQVDGSKNEWMEGWNEECVQMEGQSVFG